ncbi:MAG: leucine-rich repeat protein [Oscillospiraceae bacterium]|nr:leucine-rich repeat protein [Oscillospiraceae bacterium]
MKIRNVLALLLVVCILTVSFTACSGSSDIELPMGHRYGNPEVTYADGQATVKHTCVDCDYAVTEIRTGTTQVADAAAWYEAFGNLNKSNYSLSIEQTGACATLTQHCVIDENRGYYASFGSEEREYYTLQKNDESFITYVIDEEGTRLAEETDNSYWVQMKKVSALYLGLEDKFDCFTYDAECGSYVSTAPMDIEVFGLDGESLGVTSFDSISVNFGDGSVCAIRAEYYVLNDLLEEIQIGYHFYNIGFSVVKVPQSVIDEVAGTNAPKDPVDYFTYEIKNGAATITAVEPAINGDVAIPSAVGECPVVAIGEGAFENCAELTGITIPGSVVSIGENAFLGCEKLVKVTYSGTEDQWATIIISETGNAILLGATVQFNTECVHSYDDGIVTKEPTCGTAGIKTYTCGLCGDEKTEIITATLGHSYDDGVVIEESTCTDAGIKVCTCTVCGKSKTEYVPKSETHTYTNGTCIHCGADDPKYVGDTDSGEQPGGIWGTIVNLLQSIIEIIFYLQ